MELDLYIEAYQSREESEWRRTRELLAMIHNTNVSKRSQLKTGEQLFKLPSEQVEAEPSTLASFAEICKILGLKRYSEIN